MNIFEFLDQHMIFAFVGLLGLILVGLISAGGVAGREPKISAEDRKSLNDAAARLRAFAVLPATPSWVATGANKAADNLEAMSGR